jgi:hypothetical protein
VREVDDRVGRNNERPVQRVAQLPEFPAAQRDRV